MDAEYLADGEQKIFICDDCPDVFFDTPDKIEHRQLTGHGFIQTIDYQDTNAIVISNAKYYFNSFSTACLASLPGGGNLFLLNFG